MSEKRFVIHDSSVEEYVESLENKNTQGKTKRDVKLLNDFFKRRKKGRARVVNNYSRGPRQISSRIYSLCQTWRWRRIQISQLYFISFGFYLSSFSFYEAAFFQWLLFDHICLNKACHNLRRVFNLSMYITNNTTWKVLCTVFTHSLFCIRNLTRSLRSLVRFLILHNSCVNTVRAHFPWSILYMCRANDVISRHSKFAKSASFM